MSDFFAQDETRDQEVVSNGWSPPLDFVEDLLAVYLRELQMAAGCMYKIQLYCTKISTNSRETAIRHRG
jgi:hypothetical protein